MRQTPAIATRNPTKKFAGSRSSPRRKSAASIAVKSGATATITPTFEAIV